MNTTRITVGSTKNLFYSKNLRFNKVTMIHAFPRTYVQ